MTQPKLPVALVFDLGPNAADALANTRQHLTAALETVPGIQVVALVPDATTPAHTHVYIVAAPDTHLPTLRQHAIRHSRAAGMATAVTLHIRPSP